LGSPGPHTHTHLSMLKWHIDMSSFPPADSSLCFLAWSSVCCPPLMSIKHWLIKHYSGWWVSLL